MYKMYILLLISIALTLSEAKVANEVAEFARSNGFTPITVVEVQSGRADMNIKEVLRSLSDQNIQVSSLEMKNLRPKEGKVLKNDHIFATVTTKDEWLAVMDLCSGIRIHSSLVLTSFSPSELSSLPSIDRNVQFFAFSVSSHSWFEVISIAKTNGKLIVNPLKIWKVASSPLLALPHYDFNNITLLDEELDFMPSISLQNCSNDGQNCLVGGSLGSSSTMLEEMLNITFSFSLNIAGDWGYQIFEKFPEGDCPNSSSVLKNILLGHTHISISGWYMREERSGVIDTGWQMKEHTVLVIGKKLPSAADYSFFLRPFHQNVWIVTLVLLLAILGCKCIIKRISGKEAQSCRLLNTSLFFLFVVLHAFYGGALTMFFANEPNPPFKSLEGAMKAHPEWELLVSAEHNFYPKPNNLSSKAYIDFWKRAVEKREEKIQVTNNLEGLRRVATEKSTMQLYKSNFNHLSQDPSLRQYTFKIVAESITVRHLAAILPKNSPLTPAISYAYLALMETGTTSHLVTRWNAKPTRKINNGSPSALGVGDTILAFIIMAMALATCLILLGMEWLVKKFYRKKTQEMLG